MGKSNYSLDNYAVEDNKFNLDNYEAVDTVGQATILKKKDGTPDSTNGFVQPILPFNSPTETPNVTEEQLGIPSFNNILRKSIDRIKEMPVQSEAKPDGTVTLRTPNKLYNPDDDAELTALTNKYNPVTIEGVNKLVDNVNDLLGIKSLPNSEVSMNPYALKLRQASALEQSIKNNIIDKEAALSQSSSFGTVGLNKNVSAAENNELSKVQAIKKKISAELAITGANEADAIVSTDQSGNLLNKASMYAKIMMGDPQGGIELNESVEQNISKLPTQFFTGLNYYKNADPATFERLTNSVKNNLPLSESQVAQVTSEGIEIEQARLDRKIAQKELSPDEFNAQSRDLQKKRYDNLINNKETLRAVLSNGIAEKADAVERNMQVDIPGGGRDAVNSLFGFRWNYDANEIQSYGEKTALELGLDPKNPNVKEAIKYLQDNEGAMVMQNSIAKNGMVRELSKGLADPVRGVVSALEDVGKTLAGDTNSIYVQGQSQSNVNVSEQRLKAEDVGWRGVVNDVTKGAGQFATQAGMALATSGLIGTAAEGLQAANFSSKLGGLVAGETGMAVEASKDFASTMITSFAQVYDGNLKQALNYTSDNSLAKKAAFINSTIEGLSENILSPIEVAHRIGSGFKTKAATEGLLDVLSEKNLLETPNKLTDFLKATIKGAVETGKVAGTEIGEEFVTQIADFATNAYLNPNSEAFQNRDLAHELAQTAYQTGLTMAIPALASGVSSSNVNSFSKGSLMVAAQNRQQLVDDLASRLANGEISDEEHNRKLTIINTAAKANESLPLKADGTSLSADEKADYVFSRTSEAVMQHKMDNSNDAAEKQVYAEKIKAQQDFRTGVLNTANETVNPAEVVATAAPKVEENTNVTAAAPIDIQSIIPAEELKHTETTLGRIDNADNINVADLGRAEDALYTALDKSPEAAHLIEPLILKIQSYPDEFKTKTETSTVTETRPVEGTFAAKSKQEIRPALEQSIGRETSVTRPDGHTQVGTLAVVDGNYVVKSEGNQDEVIGERQITNRDLKLPSEERVPEPIQFDENQNVKSVTFEAKDGSLVTVNDPETALNIAIQLQADAVGEIPDAAFEKAYEQVSRTVTKEVPVPITFTRTEQAAVDAIKAREFTGGVKNWTDVIRNDNAPIEDRKQALKELTQQLTDPNSEPATGAALGGAASDAIYALSDEQSKSQSKNTDNAVQKQTATEGVLRDQRVRGESGLPKVEQNNQSKVPAEESNTQQVQQKQVVPATERKSLADRIRAGKIGKDIAMSGVPFLKEVWNGALEALATSIELTGDLAQAIQAGVDHIKSTDWYKGLTAENKQKAEDKFRSENADIAEETPEQVADRMRKDELTWDEAIDGRSQAFIDKLDKLMFGGKRLMANESPFRQAVLDLKNYGINEADIVAKYDSAKKLTKRQRQIVSEVFGDTAETDAAAKELQEAFKKLAMGEKPKSVLKRLGVSDVTHLVKALSDVLSYKAIPNIQLEAMADYIVDSIELDKSDRYINAMVNNSMADVKQVLRAKLVVALQKAGNEELATQFVRDMADDAVSAGRQTQSLVKAYEILGTKGNAKMRSAFAAKYAESVQKKALEMTKRYAEAVTDKEAEIARLNERIHAATQQPSTLDKIKEVISNLCGLRKK